MTSKFGHEHVAFKLTNNTPTNHAEVSIRENTDPEYETNEKKYQQSVNQTKKYHERGWDLRTLRATMVDSQLEGAAGAQPCKQNIGGVVDWQMNFGENKQGHSRRAAERKNGREQSRRRAAHLRQVWQLRASGYMEAGPHG